jgi:hypothetical protein
MCKKGMLVAALAVLAAVALIGGRKFVSHCRYWKDQLRTAVERRIPPEQEIARLRADVERLKQEDGKAYDKVVRQKREVKRLEAKFNELEKQLVEEEGAIREKRASLTNDSFITFRGEKRSREEFVADLRQAASAFQLNEARLNSLKEQLTAKKEAYELNKKSLFERELAREKLRTELQRLETALTRERQAQARESDTLDDSSYLRIQEEIGAVAERIGQMTDKRELKNEVQARSNDRTAQQRREKEAQIDKYLETRFGNKPAAE